MARKKTYTRKNTSDEIVIKTNKKNIYINNFILSGVLLAVFYIILKYAELTISADTEIAAKSTLVALPIVLVISLISSYLTCSNR